MMYFFERQRLHWLVLTTFFQVMESVLLNRCCFCYYFYFLKTRNVYRKPRIKEEEQEEDDKEEVTSVCAGSFKNLQ